MNSRSEVKGLAITKLGLICCLQAINPMQSCSINNSQINKENQVVIVTPKLKMNEPNFLDLENKLTNIVLQELIVNLVRDLDKAIIWEFDNVLYGNSSIQTNKRIKQYLRKFTFYYCFYMAKYPMRLANFSQKKINMLAIKTLFFVYSL